MVFDDRSREAATVESPSIADAWKELGYPTFKSFR